MGLWGVNSVIILYLMPKIPAHIRYFSLAVLLLIAAINYTRTTLNILHSSQRYGELEQEVIGLQQKKTLLERELEYKKTDDFIEKEARLRLNLIKSGERVFLRPEGLNEELEGSVAGTVSNADDAQNAHPYEQWMKLLF